MPLNKIPQRSTVEVDFLFISMSKHLINRT
jgi:hypothetical protein